MDTYRIKISKLEAARRQLDTAIRLYFSHADPVSIHTLAAAALDLLKNLDEQGPKTGTFYDHLETNVKPEYLKEANNIFRAPQNFFKHANTDPERVLDFLVALPELFLISGCEKYHELAAEETPEMLVYRLWFSHHNPEFLTLEAFVRMHATNFSIQYSPTQRREFFNEYLGLAAVALANILPGSKP
jgi:hypothetical protein